MSDQITDPVAERNKLFALFGVLFVFCVVLFYITPYTRDDWAWGSSIGLDRLSEWFKDYNGRYGGNIAEIVLTNFRWLKALVSAIVISAIIYLMVPKKGNRFFMALLAIALILMEPIAMMRQTVVYTAGFSNYVIPTAFMLIILKYFSGYLEKDIQEKRKQNPVVIISMSVLACISGLFMEHITLYLVSFAFILNVYFFYIYKRPIGTAIGFFIGSVGGAVIMFSNGAYWNVLSGNDGYRELGVSRMGNLYSQSIGNILYLENWLLNILTCIMVAVTLNLIDKDNVRIPIKIIGYGTSIILILMMVIVFIVNMTDVLSEYEFWAVFANGVPAVGIYIICFMGCVFSMIMGSVDKIVRTKMIFLAMSLIVVSAPLIIVNPVSPRCFFPTFVLFGMFLLQCISQIEINKKWNKYASLFVAGSMTLLLIIYIPIYNADNKRLEMIRDRVAAGEKSIVINKLPNESWVWGATPESGTKWEYRYKKFYDIPIDVTLLNEG